MCNRLNIRLLLVISCFQWFKDTKMKTNYNFGDVDAKYIILYKYEYVYN